MITIIGTAHILNLREKVQNKIRQEKPQAVCLELDKRRYEALLADDISLTPLHLFQRYLAAMHGSKLGNDMVGAIEGAKEVGAKVFLVDRPIEETMMKLMYACTYEFLNPLEVFRKFSALTSAQLPIELSSMTAFFPFKDWMDEAIKQFEASPEKYRSLFGEIYPLFKNILLDQREEYMAAEIRKVASEQGYKPICVVAGLAHLTELRKQLQDLDVKVVTVGELGESD